MLHIKNATVYTMGKDGIVKNCDILCDKGKIIKVGKSLKSKNAKVINATGKVVIPGIVDAHSHIGTFNTLNHEQDANEMTNPNTANMDVINGIDPNNASFKECLKDGITTSVITPGSGNVFGGLVVAYKSGGNKRVVKHPVALKAAMGINPKGIYGLRNVLPMSRMGVASIFIDYFKNVQDYLDKKKAAKGVKSKMPPFDQALENGALVLTKKIPLKVHSYQHDMMTLLKWSNEYHFQLTLDHAFGSSDFYDEITKNKDHVQVIWGPQDGPLFGGEGCKNDPEGVIELTKRGVTCAIMTDGPVFHPYMIITEAGEIVRRGADVETALKMITINAAKIARCDKRIGSIEVGKDADILIFDGTPALDTDAKLLTTIIDGDILYKA